MTNKEKEYIVVMKNGHTFSVYADFEFLIEKFQESAETAREEEMNTVLYFGRDVIINVGDISTIHLKLDSDK